MDEEPQRGGRREGGRDRGSRYGERVMRSEGLVVAAEVTDSSLPALCLYSSSGTPISCPRSGMWAIPRDNVSLSKELHSAKSKGQSVITSR